MVSMGYARTQRETFNFLTEGELDLLEGLTKNLPPNPAIVNIGAGYGTSGLVFVETRADAIVYTIDNRADSHPDGSMENERMAFANAGLLHLLHHRWYQILTDSQAFGKRWLALGNPPVDLVFIDGGHDYAACAGDIDAWLPTLTNGGIMVVHDFDKAQNDPREHGRNHPFAGVDKAVRERLLIYGYPVAGHVDTMIAIRREV